jgi:UDP:flavonoid glycosyltransferase YjiC (YdhE family)
MLERKEKAVLVAFGSNAMIRDVTVQPLFEGLKAALDSGVIHKVFWSISKSQGAVTGFSHPKIKWMPWVPQYAMLQHAALSVFVSHMGAESAHEGMYTGTPLLCIPIFGDQPGNARRAQELGVGLAFHKYKFSAQDILQAIHNLTDPSGPFPHNCNKIKDIARRAARKGLDDAVDLIETVGYHGDSFLFPDNRQGSFIRDSNYDILAVCGLLLVGLFYLMFRVTRGMFRLCRSSSRVGQAKKTN